MNATEFITEIAPIAVEDMMQSGVLASITIAQGMLESAHGNHAPGNNFFGIKSVNENEPRQLLWTQEYEKGRWIQVQAWFRVYPDLSGCIADHSSFLHHPRYVEVLRTSANLDYRGAARALQNAGYATDPGYAQNLINIIEGNNLYTYDKEAFLNLLAIDDLQKKVAALEAQLEPIPTPKWFTDEFGPDALKGIINNPLHAEIYWENAATIIRMLKK